MRLISVVLPVYNESGSIGPCLRGLWAALASEDHEILVCYDSEEDTTLPAIAAMPDRPPSVRLVRNTLGRGALNAIKTGFDAARGDVVVTSMADLSDPPAVILAMAGAIRAGADVVSGSRYMRGGSQRGGPWLKRTLSRIAGVSLRWLAGLGTHDATSNFRAYSRGFLETVEIESRGGFEIALELTVKAHLGGRVVGEVPSSWVDRSSGKSNFRMWKWMPNYLRWYLGTILEPACVWGAGSAAFLFSISRPPWSDPPALVHRTTAWLYAAAAVFCLLVARRVRGRMKFIDVLLVVVWLHPWHGAMVAAGHLPVDLAACTIASAVLLGLSCGTGRMLEALRSAARRLRPASVTTALVLTIVAAGSLVAHALLPIEIAGQDLDPSWAASLQRAILLDLRAGVDYVFTFGPLGGLSTRAYSGELFALKIFAWEYAFKLALTIVLILVALRIRGRLDRVLFLVLLTLPSSPDSHVYLCILAVTVWILEREEPRIGVTLFGFLILAILALVKFVYLVPVMLCVLAILAGQGRRLSRGSAAALGATFALLLGAAWWTAGQHTGDFPTWIRRSLQVSSGYTESCSTAAPPGTNGPAMLLLALFAVQGGLLFAAGSRRLSHGAIACAAVPIAWIAYKGGFVRASDHTPIFFSFTLVAPFVLATAGGLGPVLNGIGLACRVACVGLSLAGLAAADPPPTSAQARFVQTARNLARTAGEFVRPFDLRTRCEERLEGARQGGRLPRTRAAVGDHSIDMVSHQQGLLFLNDLRWDPRPVFQSYLTFTPELMELNARFLESERASDFILFHLESIDTRLPAMDDALALQVIARDYEAVLAEQGHLLLRRDPRKTSCPEVELETELAFGQPLELSKLEGRCHLLSLEIRTSPWGRVRSILDQSPELHAELELDSGEKVTARIVPGMMRAGMIVDPFLRTQRDWMSWYTGAPLARPVRLRILEPGRSGYEDTIGVKVFRADGITPRARPELATEANFSHFKTLPSGSGSSLPAEFTVMRKTEVLVFPAPSEIRFEVEAGRRTLSGRYGILPRDWQSGRTGGADFRAILRMPGSEDVVVFSAHLDPVRVERDQRLKYLKVAFEAPAAGALILCTDPGPGADPCHETVWTAVEVD